MENSELDRAEGAEPLYIQISSILRAQIMAGEIGEVGAPVPSENQLSEIFGVARGTIRQALAVLEREGYVRRERGRGAFIASPEATDSQTENHIVFVVPHVRDSFISTMLLGVERSARTSNLSVIFTHTEHDIEKQNAAIAQYTAQKIAGFVIYPVDSVKAGAISDLVASNYPLVLVDRYFPQMVTDFVVSDNFGGALKAVRHLCQLGYERVGCVFWGNTPVTSIDHRLAGYRQALQECGHEHEFICTSPDFDEIKSFIVNSNGPQAIFALNDHTAITVYHALREDGIKIPEERALIGFDDLEVAQYLETPLTTVAQSAFEMGQRAVEFLARRIHNMTDATQQAFLPTRLIVRRSCGS